MSLTIFLFPGKRAAAQKAEKDFFTLLREHNTNEKPAWKDFKRKISSDPRYEAVGSSSLREELFNTFLKVNADGSPASHPTASSSHAPEKKAEEDPEEVERKKKEKRERGLREREQQVKADLSKVEAQIERSRVGLNKEEDERDFRCAQLTMHWRRISVALNVVRSDFFQDPAYGCNSRPTGKLSVGVELFAKSVRFSGYMGFRSPTTQNGPKVYEVYTTSEPQTSHLPRPRRKASSQAHSKSPRLIRITNTNPRYHILDGPRRLVALFSTCDEVGFQ